MLTVQIATQNLAARVNFMDGKPPLCLKRAESFQGKWDGRLGNADFSRYLGI